MMWSYFKPLRRKIGVVILIMACVFAAGWMSSFYLSYHIVFPVKNGSSVYCINTAYNMSIGLMLFDRAKELSEFLKWDQLKWTANDPIVGLDDDFEASINWRFRLFGCGIGKLKEGMMGTASMKILVVPYWSIVIPLTLLSAWLLLSKPRTGKVVESTPN